MSVYRRKETRKDGTTYLSENYHYKFQWRGRKFSGNTGEKTKRKAELAEKRIREDLKTPRDDTSIDGAFQRWWEEKGQSQARSDTIFWRLSLLQDNLEEILAQEGRELNLSAITTNHLAQYVQVRGKQPNRRNKLPSPSTINREIQLLRMVMRRALMVWEKEIRLPNFGDVLNEERDELVVEISNETYEAIRAGMREDYHDVMDFLVLAGNRAGNVLVNQSRLLKPEDVDFDNMEVTFHVKSKKPGGRRVVIPITQPMLVILANNINNHPDAVFTYVAKKTWKGRTRGQRYPISLSGFYGEFKKAAKEAKRPELRVHDLRHTSLTRTLRATGGNLRAAQQQAGHTRVTTTQKYAHLMTSDLREALETAHNLHENGTNEVVEMPNPLKAKRES